MDPLAKVDKDEVGPPLAGTKDEIYIWFEIYTSYCKRGEGSERMGCARGRQRLKTRKTGPFLS